MVQPWMQALEMKFATLRVCVLAEREVPSSWESKEFGVANRHNIQALKSAETYSWSVEVTKALRFAAASIPAETVLPYPALPSSCGWWWFDGGFGAHDLVAISWCHDPPQQVHLACYVWEDRVKAPACAMVYSWPSGFTLKDLIDYYQSSRPALSDPTTASRHIGQFVLAACAWIQQRIAVFGSEHIERHRRKQLAREHNVPLPSDVKVIQLRRTESQSRPLNSNGGDPVEWACRWIVNGHWRNQPYPSKDEHKLIYIMPYVKGPPDQPLRVPTHTVYSVSR